MTTPSTTPEPELKLGSPSHASKVDAPSVSSPRTLLLQTLIVTAIIIGLVALAAKFAYDPLTQLAQSLVERFGVAGILFGLFLSDSIAVPVPTDLYLALAVASQAPLVPLTAAICVVSMIAGTIAFKIGPNLQRIGFIRRRIEAFRPRGEVMFQRFGVWAVAIGALTPLPYSITCWFAGIYGMPTRRFLLANFFRAPRMIIYIVLIANQWVDPAAVVEVAAELAP